MTNVETFFHFQAMFLPVALDRSSHRAQTEQVFGPLPDTPCRCAERNRGVYLPAKKVSSFKNEIGNSCFRKRIDV